MDIKILGGGCINCRNLEKNTREALKELNIEANIEDVTDFKEIAKYGIMRTPGLVVDGKVLSYGRVPDKDEIKNMLLK
ncbi:thioredoxin family protein [Thermoanaerobacterium sp. RBIITD]|uniref:thioredoxin family protein n=1 Tax=Thermoanaerobacterium sp. RBIITD TaxID=1550240 RepID=UPI000BB6C9DA|nr:thioredoxin family protein [Thermoanaerobacterium sp. RBIITD]SNX53971.1 small redox-active disulfide protein 2 [Thermoanaerobacterium sp. RBIITD]